MNDVIDLDARREHWAGTASCIDCRHEWTAVAPVQTDRLECPQCSGLGVRYSRREVSLIRALEAISTGTAPNEGPATNLEVARQIGRDALIAAGWPPNN